MLVCLKLLSDDLPARLRPAALPERRQRHPAGDEVRFLQLLDLLRAAMKRAQVNADAQ